MIATRGYGSGTSLIVTRGYGTWIPPVVAIAYREIIRLISRITRVKDLRSRVHRNS
jgi:predicted MPP superfamily phosphohydrolase